jgi:hypothetical protein
VTIRDQRHMFQKLSVAEIRGLWNEILAQKALGITPDQRKVVAFVNLSRWVAECPECEGGIACWVDNPTGCCLDCGHEFAVIFPPPDVYAAGVAVLLRRQREKNRNWRPDEETVERLQTENDLCEGVLG